MDKLAAYRAGFAQGYFEKSAGDNPHITSSRKGDTQIYDLDIPPNRGALSSVGLLGTGGALAGLATSRYLGASPLAQVLSSLGGSVGGALIGVALADITIRDALAAQKSREEFAEKIRG